MPPPRPVRFDMVDRVATLTLDVPANRNALSVSMRAELVSLFASIDAATDVDVVVLTHSGTVFSSGLDLSEVLVDGAQRGLDELSALIRSIRTCARPVVAVVTGAVRAGALGLLACCDVVIAGADATFGLPEVRVGLVPALVAEPLRSRLSAGALRAWMLTGEVIGADTALRLGLVDRVGGAVDLVAQVAAVVGALRQGAPSAHQAIKELFADSDPGQLTLAQLAEVSAARFASADAGEGIQAWRERRPPRWRSAAQPD